MELGKKIKMLRLECGLTQEELALRCELSKGYISQLENDLTSPSIATLADLLTVLGSRLDVFFSEDKEEKPVFTPEEYFENVTESSRLIWLVPNSQKNMMEPVFLELKPNAVTAKDMPHEGEEFGYVLSGRIKVCTGKFKYPCKKGDSFYIRCDKEHWLENIGNDSAKLIWVSTPPNF